MFRFVKRLFEPAVHNKVKTLKMSFEGLWEYMWWDLIPIVSIPLLINYINKRNYQSILHFALEISIAYIGIWIIHFFIRRWDIEARFSYEIYLTTHYLRRSILKDPTSMDKIGTGKVQSIVKSGIEAWTDVNYNILYALVKTFFGIVTGLYIVFNFSIKYVPYFLVIMILSCVAYYYFKKIKLKYDERANDIQNNLNKDYVRIIMSKQEVILAVNENKETRSIIDLVKKQLVENSKSAKYDFLADLTVSGVVTILPFIGIYFLVSRIELNATNIAFLVSFIYFCSRLTGTMYNMVWVIKQVFENYPKIKTFWNFLDDTPNFENYYKGEKFQHGNGSIELDSINFSYEEKEILNAFNLKIKGGNKIALVGKSGSGKTTIAKLIAGFVTPKDGQVFVDGQDLSRISLKSYYKHIGYLTQEPMVFDGSIRSNLLYSLPDDIARITTDHQLYLALKNAECDFVTDLDVQIGEKGIRLSGGERQRLAIAKLMLKNPEIIILDEPTSALDSFSEDAITKALDRLFENKTVVIIAHRLQTVKKADFIYVMENGKIIEWGTHAQLSSSDGEYRKMVHLQSGF